MSKRSRSARRRMTAILLTVVLILVLILAGLVFYLYRQLTAGEPTASLPSQTTTASAPTETAEVTIPEETTPAPVSIVSATGSKTDIRCKASYTAADDAAAKQTAAAAGTAKLTNAQLQVLYADTIAEWKAGRRAENPDFSLPLDTQPCPLTEGLSWQHFFLEKALSGWQMQQAILAASRQPQIIEEEAFKPNLTDDLHGKYIAPELPVNNFLYQDRDCYTPNAPHQAWLDGLEEQLTLAAKSRGFASLSDYASAAGTSASALVKAAQDYNTAYMYFTERSYELSVSEEEIAEHAGEFASDGHTVDFRHILMIPQGAEVAGDGTVTADDAQWEKCRKAAEQLLNEMKWAPSRGNTFPTIANQKSQDAGSALNGGLYVGVAPGQLTKALDEWLFAPERAVNNTEIIRSDVGYHIIKLTAIHQNGEAEAKNALLQKQEEQLVKGWLDTCKLKPDYSAVALWVDTTADLLSLEEVLYPDIAHERFPEAIVYLQQDYMYTPFGSRDVGHNGCGITTMAMLSTYMTDTIQTPAMMAARFGNYFDGSGTDGDIFLFGVVDMGFFSDGRAFSIDNIIEPLKNGQMVISQQQGSGSVFTSTAHYLLLQKYNEEDDTFQIRDSNVYNYGRLNGHKIDAFTRGQLASGGTNFYILQPKIVRIPACARCGISCDERSPEALIQDYICEKCIAALSRRNNFLTILNGI